MGRFTKAIREELSSYEDTTWTGTIGNTEVTLAARPLTPLAMQKHAKRHPGFMHAPSMEGMVDMLIQEARDADTGEAAFDRGDAPFLMRLSNSKVSDIFGGLFAESFEQYDETDEDFEARVKNSKATASD